MSENNFFYVIDHKKEYLIFGFFFGRISLDTKVNFLSNRDIFKIEKIISLFNFLFRKNFYLKKNFFLINKFFEKNESMFY